MVRRKKGTAPPGLASDQRQHTPPPQLGRHLGAEAPLPSVNEIRPATARAAEANTREAISQFPVHAPFSAHDPSSSDMNVPMTAIAGVSSTAPDVLLDINAGTPHTEVPGAQAHLHQHFSVHGPSSSVLNVPISASAGQPPTAVPGPQAHQYQHIEDPGTNSQTSSEDSSSSHAGLENYELEEQMVEEPTLISLPNTRSRILASYIVEDRSNASLGPITSSSCHGMIPVPSSSTKKEKRRRPRKS